MESPHPFQYLAGPKWNKGLLSKNIWIMVQDNLLNGSNTPFDSMDYVHVTWLKLRSTSCSIDKMTQLYVHYKFQMLIQVKSVSQTMRTNTSPPQQNIEQPHIGPNGSIRLLVLFWLDKTADLEVDCILTSEQICS